MTVSDGCYAHVLRRRRAARSTGSRIEEQEARSSDRLGRRVPGRLRRRALPRPLAGRVPALRGGLRRRVVQHFGAGLIDPSEVDRLLAEVEAEHLEIGAEIG